jgi:uncharacterized protein (DUF302 family)
MATQTTRLRKLAKQAGKRASSAVRDMEKKLEKRIRRATHRAQARKAGKALLEAGAAALAGAAVEGMAKRVRRRRRGLAGKALGFEVMLPLPPAAAVERVTDALRAEGFGILSRIDVAATLHEKLGVEFRPYMILGACNPALAYRALTARAETGLLLPCNVTVEAHPEKGSLVRIADPETMLVAGPLGSDPELRRIAEEVGTRLSRAARVLAAHAGAVVL